MNNTISTITVCSLNELKENLVGYSLLNISNNERGDVTYTCIKDGLVKKVSYSDWMNDGSEFVGEHWFRGTITDVCFNEKSSRYRHYTLILDDCPERTVSHFVHFKDPTNTSAIEFQPFSINLLNYPEQFNNHRVLNGIKSITNYHQIDKYITEGIDLLGTGFKLINKDIVTYVLKAHAKSGEEIHLVLMREI